MINKIKISLICLLLMFLVIGIVNAEDNNSKPLMHIISGYSVGEDTTASINLLNSEKQPITGQSTVHIQGKLYKISGSSININVKLPSDTATLTIDDGAFALNIKKSDSPSGSLNIGLNKKIKTYCIILKDSNGNPIKNKQVIITINNVEKSVNTDSNGEVLISVSVPKYTEYADISYNSQGKTTNTNEVLGVSSHDSSSLSKVVLVASKIKASTSKSFKVKVKNKKFSLSLVDKNNKPIKFQKVTLKINGKTFKTTTNKYGKASFKITNLHKKGAFNGIIKYKGTNKYSGTNKNIKIIVK